MTEQRDRGVSRRLEQEIEEILARSGDLAPPPRAAHRPPPQPDTRKWAPGMDRAGSLWSRLGSAGQLMALALLLTLVAYVAWYRSALAGFVFTVLAVGCFLGAYLRGWRGPQALGRERRWRGQRLDFTDYRTSDLGGRLRRWWQRLSRRW
ncbi:MAG: hypothetical protein KatS3mg061_1014 [Dehalococcoidia bacterium]|nr:MAG: hypothetical protein KatS3mg061_1014 [Dehalococcoidia bacterium]